eukprot:SAG31_NODE_211_length_20274_cov_40.333482_10_plen_56_part_00
MSMIGPVQVVGGHFKYLYLIRVLNLKTDGRAKPCARRARTRARLPKLVYSTTIDQ